MTNRENMKKVIKNDFDKENNYKKIIEGIDRKNNKFNYKYIIIPITAIIILVLIVGLSTNGSNTKELKKFSSDDFSDGINTSSRDTDATVSNSTSKSVEVNEIEGITKTRNNIKVVNNVNIPYFEMLSNLSIPNDFDNKEDYRAIYIKNDNKSSKEDYILNNYEFHYKNTKNEREIITSFSKNYIPISNYNFGVNSKMSKINGFSVLLYKYDKVYIAKFAYADYNFIVEGKDISENEFISFISSIIK